MAMERDQSLCDRIRTAVEMCGRAHDRTSEPDLNALRRFRVLPGRLHGRAVKRAVVALRTRGCRWLRTPGGTCTYCGLGSDGLWDPHLRHCAIAARDETLHDIGSQDVPLVCLYTAGSFLDDQEISAEERLEALSMIRKVPGLEAVLIESRPEFVMADRIREIKDALGGVDLIVGVGLDAVTDDVRTLCANKQFDLSTYARSVDAVKQVGAGLLTYVVLKPPFLLEGESVQEATRTAEYAFAHGSDTVSLEPVSVQAGTLTELLWKHGLYRPPWLWSVAKVATTVAHLGEVAVGGAVVYPASERDPHNCPLCSDRMRSALQAFSVSQDKSVVAQVACSCKEEWDMAVRETGQDLRTRIQIALDQVGARLGE